MEEEDIHGLLERYEVEVTWMPDNVNPHGELENILDGRDIIEDGKGNLTKEELQRLASADERLRKYADRVPKMIGFDFRKWREKNCVPRSRWWWWADELAKPEGACVDQI